MNKKGAALSITLLLSACSPVPLLAEADKSKFPYSFASQSVNIPVEKLYKPPTTASYDENNQIRKENWEASYNAVHSAISGKIK